MKKLLNVRRNAARHWVGDGFPVRTVLSYQDEGPGLSPFLLLDHAGPAGFRPTSKRLGVDFHPHRGFETVTVVYQGELEHRDSAGNAGRIGVGDVQWMTAGAGLLHEEKHSADFAKRGGTLEMVQLWVNLPAAHKREPPGYQTLLAADVPAVALGADAGAVRVIAGSYAGANGPARTFTPIDLWDLRLRAGERVELPVRDGRPTAIFVRKGEALLEGGERARAGELAIFDAAGVGIAVHAGGDLEALVLSGAPIDEPIAGYGPFVMNTEAEIDQAIDDYQNGRFGRPPV
jgi:redox-sensitive bicupin YhaK (pirin superfamily)